VHRLGALSFTVSLSAIHHFSFCNAVLGHHLTIALCDAVEKSGSRSGMANGVYYFGESELPHRSAADDLYGSRNGQFYAERFFMLSLEHAGTGFLADAMMNLGAGTKSGR
jgi:hypothetical protein